MSKKVNIVIAIALCVLTGICASSVNAAGVRSKVRNVEQTAPSQLSVEREQQFTYYWYAARQCLEHKEYAKALIMLQLCEQLNPRDAMTKAYLGVVYEFLGQDDKAMNYYRQAYLLDPAERWFQYIKALYETKNKQNYKEILSVSENVVRLKPTESAVWENLQQAAIVNQNFKLAIKAQDKVDALEGYSGLSAINRYRIYLMAGNTKKALQAINQYLEKDPNNLQFLLFRVQLMEAMQVDPTKLETEYIRILRLEPGNLVILNNYAYLLAVTGRDLRKAEQMSLQTLREQPDNPVFLDTYAWILHLQGQNMLARFYIKKALENAEIEDRPVIEAHYIVIMR